MLADLGAKRSVLRRKRLVQCSARAMNNPSAAVKLPAVPMRARARRGWGRARPGDHPGHALQPRRARRTLLLDVPPGAGQPAPRTSAGRAQRVRPSELISASTCAAAPAPSRKSTTAEVSTTVTRRDRECRGPPSRSGSAGGTAPKRRDLFTFYGPLAAATSRGRTHAPSLEILSTERLDPTAAAAAWR